MSCAVLSAPVDQRPRGPAASRAGSRKCCGRDLPAGQSLVARLSRFGRTGVGVGVACVHSRWLSHSFSGFCRRRFCFFLNFESRHVDGGDLHTRVFLPMTRVAFRILTASQFLNFEFFGFHFRFDDLGFNKGSVNQRSSDGAGAAGIGEQHPVKCDALTRLRASGGSRWTGPVLFRREAGGCRTQ